MKLQLIVAGVCMGVGGLILWKLPAVVGALFILICGLLGFFAAKNNKGVADKFK